MAAACCSFVHDPCRHRSQSAPKPSGRNARLGRFVTLAHGADVGVGPGTYRVRRHARLRPTARRLEARRELTTPSDNAQAAITTASSSRSFRARSCRRSSSDSRAPSRHGSTSSTARCSTCRIRCCVNSRRIQNLPDSLRPPDCRPRLPDLGHDRRPRRAELARSTRRRRRRCRHRFRHHRLAQRSDEPHAEDVPLRRSARGAIRRLRQRPDATLRRQRARHARRRHHCRQRPRLVGRQARASRPTRRSSR